MKFYREVSGYLFPMFLCVSVLTYWQWVRTSDSWAKLCKEQNAKWVETCDRQNESWRKMYERDCIPKPVVWGGTPRRLDRLPWRGHDWANTIDTIDVADKAGNELYLLDLLKLKIDADEIIAGIETMKPPAKRQNEDR